MASTTTSDSSAYTRLHITPLDESLLKIVVPASVLPKARNVSFHTIETFPEKRYGFVELPKEEAEKIKKKLNGAMLKGTKVRIEPAREPALPTPTDTAEDLSVKKKKSKKEKGEKSKKRKRENDVIEGVDLEGRKVKRGWTTTEQDKVKEKRERKDRRKDKGDVKEKSKDKKAKKREVKSKYTDGPECLFKTKLPSGPSLPEPEDISAHKRTKRKSDREVIVHEFGKTVKHPSFLKDNTTKTDGGVVRYEDSKGWVDEKGNVVETSKSKRPAAVPKTKKPTAPPVLDEDDETSSSGSSEEESDNDTSDDDNADEAEHKVDAEAEKIEDEMKSPPLSATIPATKLKLDTSNVSSPLSGKKTESSRPKSSGSATSLTIKIPPTTPSATKIHPLEALYKRPKGSDGTAGPAAAGESQPFSFFDNEDVEEDEVIRRPSLQVPMTPYTQQDFEFRNVRSAAPTPDTAHPTRSYNLWPRNEEDDIEEVDEEETEEQDVPMSDAQPAAETAEKGEQGAAGGDFQKWFWENRGDLNRSWKKRRKAASKDKRYRENRARADRAI